jgi:hypothetical protein
MKLKELLPEYSGKVSDDKLSSVALNSQEISLFKKNIAKKL